MALLHKLKARLMLAREEKVADAEVIAEALRVMAAHKGGREEKLDLGEYAGFIKGGKKFNADDEVDQLVYGA